MISEKELQTSFPKVADILNNEESDLFNQLALNELEELYNDYKIGDENFKIFCEKTIWHESIGMKILATRILLKLGPNWLHQKLKLAMNKFDPNHEYFLHPIFYFRITSPKINHKHTINDALFDSQPHYDRSFGIKAFSFWLALVDINDETGGLCFFEKARNVNNLFPSESKINQYDSTKYVKNHLLVDKEMSDYIKRPQLEKGQAYVFSWYDLHGATKPKSKQRISFDIRIHDLAIKDRDKHPFVLYAFQRSAILSLFISLYEYGDKKFFTQNKNLRKIYEFFQHVYPKNNILQNTFDRLKWREEYTWTDNEKFRSLFQKKDIINFFNNWDFSSTNYSCLQEYFKQ